MPSSTSSSALSLACPTCTRLNRECYDCYLRREKAEEDAQSNLPISILPNSDLSVRKLLFIEHYLATHSIPKAAKLSKITPQTAYNYLADPVVLAEIRARAFIDLGSQRVKVAEALINGATNPKSKDHAAAQRIYWQLIGDLKDKREITGKDGGPIQVDHDHNFDSLPIEEKRKIIAILERNGQVVSVESEEIEDDDYEDAELIESSSSSSSSLRAVPMPIPPR